MRLWSLHSKYLDTKGLVALWREALLAQKVLQGLTKGYTNHPQLERFKALPEPVEGISNYLVIVQAEALARGYNFDYSKIAHPGAKLEYIPVTTGQLLFEWSHLMEKLKTRSPERYEELGRCQQAIKTNMIFQVIPGDVESWEKV